MDIRATQPDDLPALAKFLAAQGLQSNVDVLKWKYPSDTDPPPRSWMAVLDDEIVGHIGVIPATVSSGNPSSAAHRAGWFVDWMVREDLRSRGIGVFLLREASAHYPTLMTIQGSADTRKALPQLGWSAPAMLALYKLNIRPIALGTNLLQRCATTIAQRAWFHPVRHQSPKGWRLLPDNETDDASWKDLHRAVQRLQASPPPLNHFPRSTAFLHWWLRDHPTHRYRCLIARDCEGPAAYAIWRTARESDGRIEGRVVDIQAPWDQPETWTWLVSETTRRITRAGADQVCCLAGPGTPLADALTRNRFLTRQELPLWINSTDQITSDSRWHATLADSDIDTAAEA